MLAFGFGHWDEWELQHKVTFDGRKRTITVNSRVTEINIQVDVYSDWKEWVRLHDHLKFTRAIRTIGGDPTIDIQKAGDLYFMMNDWRIVIDLSKTRVTGVIFSDNFDSPFIDFTGKVVYQSLVSSLVTSITTVQNVVTGDLSIVPDNVWNHSKAAALIDEVHYIERALHIDTELLTQGTGTQGSPFNTVEALLDYAEANGYRILHVLSDITIDRNLKNFIIVGIGSPNIDCNGHNLDKSEFTHCVMKGSYTGTIRVDKSILFHGFWLNGIFDDVSLGGDLFCVDGATVDIINSQSYIPGINRPSVSMNATGSCKLGVRGYYGGFDLRDSNNVNDVCTIDMSVGSTSVASSCTDGIVVLRGVGEYQDNSAGTTVVKEMLNAKSIWSLGLSDINDVDSIGYYIKKKVLTITKFIGLK